MNFLRYFNIFSCLIKSVTNLAVKLPLVLNGYLMKKKKIS